MELPEGVSFYTFNIERLNGLGYHPIRETLIPGSNHFALLCFYKEHPSYSHYWNIEYDVCFSSEWSYFFDEFMAVKADFLSSHIQRYPDCPEWMWWEIVDTQSLMIPKDNHIMGGNQSILPAKIKIKTLSKKRKNVGYPYQAACPG